jgi:hypothetical protein
MTNNSLMSDYIKIEQTMQLKELEKAHVFAD